MRCSNSSARPVARPGPRRPPRAASVSALDVGTRTVRCVVADAAGRMLARAEAPMQGPDPIAPLVQAVRGTGLAPSAVGVAVPGILDPAGRVSRSLAVPALE